MSLITVPVYVGEDEVGEVEEARTGYSGTIYVDSTEVGTYEALELSGIVYVDTAEVGTYTIEVRTSTKWNDLVKSFENVATPYKMKIDGQIAKIDGAERRIDVCTDDWMRLLKAFEVSG